MQLYPGKFGKLLQLYITIHMELSLYRLQLTSNVRAISITAGESCPVMTPRAIVCSNRSTAVSKLEGNFLRVRVRPSSLHALAWPWHSTAEQIVAVY